MVILTGEAGVGKSTLAAALARPEITGGCVPDAFAHATLILDRDFNERCIAGDVERQLRRSRPGFVEAFKEFEVDVPLPYVSRSGRSAEGSWDRWNVWHESGPDRPRWLRSALSHHALGR